jgi:hypothetical protein
MKNGSCIKQCKRGEIFNQKKGQCESAKRCKPYQRFNNITNTCFKVCDKNLRFNPKTKGCEKKCPLNQKFNNATNSCENACKNKKEIYLVKNNTCIKGCKKYEIFKKCNRPFNTRI